MDKALKEKKNFVKKYLKPMLKALDDDIVDVWYKAEINGEEYVYIKTPYRAESFPLDRVCVTADSLKALAVDAIKGLI